VVLQEERAWFGGKGGVLAILALAEAIDPVGAAILDLDNFDAVEPVFEVLALGDDAGEIPFPHWLEHFVVGAGDEVVEASGPLGGLGGGFGFVVDDLIFQAEGVLGTVFDATVALLRDLPFKFQFEAVVVLFGEKVALSFARFVEAKNTVLEKPDFVRSS